MIMLISPTPGSSGTVEYFFNGGLSGEYVLPVSIIRRVITHYFYSSRSFYLAMLVETRISGI